MRLILFYLMLTSSLSCQGQKNTKSIFILGWDGVYDGSQECISLIKNLAVDRRTAIPSVASTELIFVNDKLYSAVQYSYGLPSKRQLSDEEIGMQYIDIEPNRLQGLGLVEESNSYLGGSGGDLTIPSINNYPLQYVGKLSNKDSIFNWLPFDLHLVAPLYLDFDKLFVDYSDPLKPQILNSSELEKASSSFENLTNNLSIEYIKSPIGITAINHYGENEGTIGIPEFLQHPLLPLSPGTKRPMKFLCQISSNKAVTATHNIRQFEKKWESQYFDYLNFWGDGILYVFFDPESKVACYFIQNT